MSNRMEGLAGPGVRANGPIAAPSSPVSSSLGPPLSPEELADEPQSSLTDISQMWIKFGKTFAIIFPIYVLGYFEFSFSWVLIGLAMLFYWRRNHGNKDYRINRALAFLDHEEKAVKQTLPTSELPPWHSGSPETPSAQTPAGPSVDRPRSGSTAAFDLQSELRREVEPAAVAPPELCLAAPPVPARTPCCWRPRPHCSARWREGRHGRTRTRTERGRQSEPAAVK